MESVQLLENPMSNDNRTKVMAPTIFEVPTEKHYHPNLGFVKCLVTRVGRNRYHFAFQVEGTETITMIGHKLKSSRTSNYHLFDALRGGTNTKLSKKSGHYIGKLRRDKDEPVGYYTLYTSSRERHQVAAYVYDIPALMQQISEGQPPRKMQAVIPKFKALTNKNINRKDERSSTLEGVKTNNSCDHVIPNNRLIEHITNRTWSHHNLLAVQTRAPRFHDGQYRLNFNGRVLVASVKNMQLENEQGEILLQFGKVDEKRYHLDFKAPFNAFSAFAAALCQFDL